MKKKDILEGLLNLVTVETEQDCETIYTVILEYDDFNNEAIVTVGNARFHCNNWTKTPNEQFIEAIKMAIKSFE
jgi:hypothetical protein